MQKELDDELEGLGELEETPVQTENKPSDENTPNVQHVVEPPEQGKVNTIMTIGSEDRMPQVMHTASVSMASPAADTSNLVKVRIKYPAKWNKPKFFQDGVEKDMAKETADQFVKQGIATIITAS